MLLLKTEAGKYPVCVNVALVEHLDTILLNLNFVFFHIMLNQVEMCECCFRRFDTKPIRLEYKLM